VAVFAFESRASNVLIRNVTIEKYASVAQKGAINTCWLSARRVRAKRDRVLGRKMLHLGLGNLSCVHSDHRLAPTFTEYALVGVVTA
jgi:hypothetical protein